MTAQSYSLPSFIFLVFSCIPAIAADEDKGYAKKVRPLFAEHCFDCHGENAPKQRLRLDRLVPEFGSKEAAGQWLKVYEKLRDGDMPPRNRPRPAEADSRHALHWIEEKLRADDEQKQRTRGRVGLRRLNRVEYQNTIRDLLAIDIELKDMLPEDAAADGFDNNADALGISPVLMERYLEAAEVALKAATVIGTKPEFRKQRYSYKDEGATKRNPQRFLTREDAIVFFSSGFSPTVLKQFHASVAGRYRIRISAYAYQSDKPVTFRVYAGKVALADRDGKSHLVGYYEANPLAPNPVPPGGQGEIGRPTVIEIVDRLTPGDTIKIIPYDTIADVSHVRAPNYKGPGLAVQWVEVEGPIVASWPPESRERLFGFRDKQAAGAKPGDALQGAEQVLRRFLPQAFRRPITEAELKPYLALVRARLDDGYDFEDAVLVGLKAVLCSPRFLFFREQPGKLDDWALASRLSYFFWSTLPDQELLDLAKKGSLTKPAILSQQVERLLRDPRARAFTENFVGQWLDLRQIDATTPDKKLYPEFDELLKISMVRETELFFEEMLKSDLSVLNVVDADFSVLNERLAQHYGIAGVKGLEFRKVKLPADCGRGGLLTQASVLKVTANGTSTSPIIRGAWVLRNILGRPAPPPPPNVPAVEPDTRGATTIREQLAKHRQVASCASCHARIDPHGFALEAFDVIGGRRNFYRSMEIGPRADFQVNGKRVGYHRGPAVDASGELEGGQRFADINQYKRLLLQDKAQIVRCLTEKLLVYGTGGSIRFADGPRIDAIVARARAKNDGLRSLIHEVVESPIFLHR